jgi:hypothetical protein
MDTSEAALTAAAANDAIPRSPAAFGPGESERWHDLVAQIGAEIAAPLTAALERINALTSTGRIDRLGLRALRDEVEAARRAGMIGQQLTRFASGRLRQSHERLRLTEMLGGVLSHRSREIQARGIALTQTLRPAEVIVDPSLLFSLLNTMLDWALANAQTQIEFAIDVQPLPAHARLTCRFTNRHVGTLADSHHPKPNPLDSLTWRLLEQTALTMSLVADRKQAGQVCALTLEFPSMAGNTVEGVSAFEINDGFASHLNSQPLAGSHVLVIASRRELRVQIRDALRNMSLIVDFVNSVEEAVAFCREGLPHAIIVEALQNEERFGQLRDEVTLEVPDFVFIEIVEEGSTYELSSFSGTNVARVGRDAVATSLLPALMFELSKGI